MTFMVLRSTDTLAVRLHDVDLEERLTRAEQVREDVDRAALGNRLREVALQVASVAGRGHTQVNPDEVAVLQALEQTVHRGGGVQSRSDGVEVEHLGDVAHNRQRDVTEDAAEQAVDLAGGAC